MKNNKSLITIILVAVLVFAGLIFSVYKLTAKKGNTFYADGYVSLCDAENSEKIYFDKDTFYKNGYNNQIKFNDVSGKKQEISKYSFAFYNNGSINFLTNGVILDLNGVTNNLIPYYNIKSNYIIDYSGGKYIIHSNDEDVVLDNFIGRITDEKYIVVGNNIKLKLSSSDEFITGKYFELNFIDGENVKIDGKEINVQTISSESYILVNDSIKIDLATRKIVIDGEEKLSLEEIVVDNDANIDIKYEDIFSNSENTTGENGNNPTGNNQGGNNADEPEVKKRYEVETVTEYKNIPYVELLSTYTGSSKINLQFRVNDDSGLIRNKKVTVKYLKINDESSAKMIEYSLDGNPINFIADSLTSNSKYLVTIITSYVKNGVVFNDYVMFQRTFETKDVGIELARDYVTSSSITYNIISDSNAEYSTAKLNVYDQAGTLVQSEEFTNNKASQLINIVGLNSNTKYTAKIEDISYGYVTNIGTLLTRSDTTLKYNPFKDGLLETQPLATVNKKEGNYKFDLGNINDRDNAIKEVIYNIYEANGNETSILVKQIKKENIISFTKDFDEEVTTHKTYYYIPTVVLNDNEKTIEYEMIQSNRFASNAKTAPTAEFETELITTTSIKGKFIVSDKDNTVKTSERAYITYTNLEGDSYNVDVILSHDNCDAEAKTSDKCANVNLLNLNSNDVYTIGLHAYTDYEDEDLTPGHELIGAIKLNTQEATIIRTEFLKRELLDDSLTEEDKAEVLNKLFTELFEIELEFKVDFNNEKEFNTMKNMSHFEAYLYEGSNPNTGSLVGTMVVDGDVNIPDTYFNQTLVNPEKTYERKVITLEDFGLTGSDLIQSKSALGESLAADYVLVLSNGKSGGNDVVFKESSFHFQIDEEIVKFAQNNISVRLNELLNTTRIAGNRYDGNLDNNTTIGIKLTPNYENKKYTEKLYYRIYDVTNRDLSNNETILNKDNLPYIEFTKNITNREEIHSTNIWFANTNKQDFTYQDLFDSSEVESISDFNLEDYDEGITIKNFFRRGRVYFATIQVGVEGLNTKFPLNGPVGADDELIVYRQQPKAVLYPYLSNSNIDSTANDYVYKYKIENDVDKALFVNTNSGMDKYLYYTKTDDTLIFPAESYNCTDVNNFSCAKITNIENDKSYSLALRPILNDRYISFPEVLYLNTYKSEKNTTSLPVSYSVMKKEGSNENVYNNLFTIKLDENETNALNKVAYYNVSIKKNGVDQLVIKNITNLQEVRDIRNSLIINDKVNSKNWSYTDTYNDPNLYYAAYIDGCDDNKCIYIDYSLLYNSNMFKNLMKSLMGSELEIVVNAIYENGKIDFAHTNNQNGLYSFQIYYPENALNKDKDRYYIISNNSRSEVYPILESNLNGAYIYSGINSQKDTYGFVESNTYFTLENKYYKDPNSNTNNRREKYYFKANGVSILWSGNYYPFVIKDLTEETLMVTNSYTNLTSFDKIVPTLKQNTFKNTIDGIRYNFTLSGNDEKHGNYVYFNVYNDSINETIAIDKEMLNGRLRVNVVNGKATLPKTTITSDSVSTFDKFHLDVEKVFRVIDIGTTTLNSDENYSYDYRTGEIKLYKKNASGEFVFNEDYNDEIEVKFNICFGGLESNTSYTYKAYMKTADNKKVYLANQSKFIQLNTYDDYVDTFTTLQLNSYGYITNPRIDITSTYDNKTITLKYDISNIMGIKDQNYKFILADETYEIKKDGSSDTYKYIFNEEYCYYKTNDTCYIREDDKYTAIMTFNTKDDDLNKLFVFGTDYDITINNENINTLQNVHVRDLELPTVKVDKFSNINENATNNLEYVLKINDPDHVIKGGYYTTHLEKVAANGDLYSVTNNVNESLISIPMNEPVSFIYDTEYYDNEGHTITPKNLDSNTEYYYVLNYQTFRNNASLVDKTQNETKKYLNYTLETEGYSLGIHEFNISKNGNNYEPTLKFGYASNFIKCSDSEIAEGKCSQRAYLVGINYAISNMDKESSSLEISENRLMFDNGVLSVMNSTGSSRLGSNYYQLNLTPFMLPNDVTATYKITYKMWYATYDDEINTEVGCNSLSTSFWDSTKNLCYILSGITYSDTTNYEGGTR